MNGSQSLYVGIGASLITLGLFAYAMLAWWKSTRSKDNGDDVSPDPDQDAISSTDSEESSPDIAAKTETATSDASTDSQPLAAVEPSDSPKMAPIQLANLMRNGEKGPLVIQMGERTYASPKELQASQDWEAVKSLSDELSQWLHLPEAPSRLFSFAEDTGDNEPESMIDSINKILERRSKESGDVPRGVRLIEETGGDVRVLLGVRSYLLQELTDPSVRRLIKHAVAEWEARK